ncbi:hypothetical protein SMICM304S_09223 [Streptomyces microflavus]
MVVGDDGFTGEIEYYAYGPTKAEAVRVLAVSEGYDLSRCYDSDWQPTYRCWKRSATRTRSTPTARCAAKRPFASGRFSSSIVRSG